MSYTITAYSKPDYDDWGPDSYWGAIHWKTWYYALLAEFGEAEAKKQFVEAWTDPKAPSFGVARADYLFNDVDFIEFTKKEGLNESLESGFLSVLNEGSYNTIKGSKSAIDAAGEVVKGVAKTAKFAGYIMPLIILAVIIIVYFLFQSRIKAFIG